MWNLSARAVIEASARPSCSRTPRRVASESAPNEASKWVWLYCTIRFSITAWVTACNGRLSARCVAGVRGRPANRRDHLVQQLSAVRALAASFESLRPVRLLALWAPKGELRVNDLFLMANQAREVVPSPKMGFVPSGEWKPWASLGAYLASIQVPEASVLSLSHQMLAIGLSALIREPSGVRFVGVGVGDNESGILILSPRTASPQVGAQWADGRTYAIVESIAPDVYYYETI